MAEQQNKFKRQIEILGLVLGSEKKYTTEDLAELFNCEVLTIKRAMGALRGYGIDIHSQKSKGVKLAKPLTQFQLKVLIQQYISLCFSEYSVDKATNLFVKQLKDDSLFNVVSLQRAIDNSLIVRIDYQKDDYTLERQKEIQPIIIYKSDDFYRLLAINDGILKQFLLTKIVKIYATDKKFKKLSITEIQDLFKYSWKSWLGNTKIKVKILFDESWAEIIKQKILVESQELIFNNEDKSTTLVAEVNSLQEIATWIAGRGKGIKVLEPKELIVQVKKLAEGVLQNYN